MPLQLHDLEGIGAAGQGRELHVGDNGNAVVHVVRLADPLVLVHGGDTTSIDADHYISVGFFPGDLDLAIHCKTAGELAFGNDVPKTEATAVVPGGVVDDLGAQGLGDGSTDSGTITAEYRVVVHGVFRHHLVIVAGGMVGDPDVAHVDGLQLAGDTVAHDVQPFAVVDHLLGDDDLAVHQASQLAEDLLDLLPQFGGLDEIFADLLVVAEGGAAMHQGKEMAILEAMLLAGDVGLMEVAQEDGGQGLHVADAGAVVVPGGAGGLVGLVEVVDAQLVHEPHEAGGIAGDVAALSAALVVPEVIGGDLLVPTVESFYHFRLVSGIDAVDDDLAFLLQFPHVVADVVHTLAQIDAAAIHVTAHPGRRGFGFIR